VDEDGVQKLVGEAADEALRAAAADCGLLHGRGSRWFGIDRLGLGFGIGVQDWLSYYISLGMAALDSGNLPRRPTNTAQERTWFAACTRR
jgi:hypothetical protein